jgi:hypothetical protein
MLSGMGTAVAFTVGIIVAADGIIAAGIGAVVGTAGGTVAAGCAGGKRKSPQSDRESAPAGRRRLTGWI